MLWLVCLQNLASVYTVQCILYTYTICWTWISTTWRLRTKTLGGNICPKLKYLSHLLFATLAKIFVTNWNICLTGPDICKEDEVTRLSICLTLRIHFWGQKGVPKMSPKYPCRHFRCSSKFLLPFPEILGRSVNFEVPDPGSCTESMSMKNCSLQIYNTKSLLKDCWDWSTFSFQLSPNKLLIIETKRYTGCHLMPFKEV